MELEQAVTAPYDRYRSFRLSTDCSQSEDAYRIEIESAKKRLSPLHIKGCGLDVVAAEAVREDATKSSFGLSQSILRSSKRHLTGFYASPNLVPQLTLPSVSQ